MTTIAKRIRNEQMLDNIDLLATVPRIKWMRAIRTALPFVMIFLYHMGWWGAMIGAGLVLVWLQIVILQLCLVELLRNRV